MTTLSDASPLARENVDPLIEELFYAYDETQEHAYATAMNVLTYLVEEGLVD